MVYGSHLILSAYGFWLPNDPRGSWSDFVRSWELTRYGEATKVDTHRSVAAKPHDWKLRQAAKLALKYPAVVFTDEQIDSIAAGFAKYVERSGVTIWACAILPEHVHLVVARHRYEAEAIMTQLKGNATQRLNKDNLHPQAAHTKDGKTPSAWGERGWKVYLDSEADIVRAIGYVERNPEKERRPRQTWGFVQPFTGLH
jgi:REP element-mobilizing transposase RayT